MKRILRDPMKSLWLAGAVSAAVWLAEVHLRGWYGLLWIGYFHLAIPAGMLLFLVWLYFNCGIASLAKRIVYVTSVVAFAVGAYFLVNWSLCWHFGAFRVWAPFADWPLTFKLSLFSIYLVFPAIPILFLLLSRCFAIRFDTRGIVLGMTSYLLSIPLAMLIIVIVRHKGDADPIHAIKTGFCIPFLMGGLGMPLVYRRR